MFSGNVRASRRGFACGMIREVGDVFSFTGPLGSWMEPISSGEAEKPQRGRPKHTTSAPSIDEKPLHRDAAPDIDSHESQAKGMTDDD